MTRRKARVLLAGVAVMVVSATAIVIAGSLSLVPLIAAEALLIAGMMLLDRFAVPVERWGPGRAARNTSADCSRTWKQEDG